MDRVLRLQGHDAGLLRRGGAQVLPLPVAQHLQGRSPRPPVACSGRQIIVHLSISIRVSGEDTHVSL
jgi:hypothetical protein